MNEGVCVPYNDRISSTESTCICRDEFSGELREKMDVEVEISFPGVSIPQALLVHFITVRTYNLKNLQSSHKSKTSFIFTVLQHNYTSSAMISTKVTRSQCCPHVRDLLNASIIVYPILRRTKYYQLPYMKNPHLVCFHDNEIFLCLCSEQRNANCFHFNFNIQFKTQQFGLSLDALLDYQIRSSVPITRQPIYVKISIAVASLMVMVGFISGTLSISTFQWRAYQKVVCGIYPFLSSVTSILALFALNFKLWFLILAQASIITARPFLMFNCISTEFTLRIFLATTDWPHACVAMEWLATVILDANFNLVKSKKLAKVYVFIIPQFISVSLVNDRIHRDLINDAEESRTWCLIILTSTVKGDNSFTNISHFIAPFTIKFVSTVGIILPIVRKWAKTAKNNMENIKI
ncbi:unnamed protein product [Rotaria socialis]|nr:unnamed protein product [Rotaria socialis]CAF4459040.1 unnamed protein product [Rotaria socialis]